MLNASKPVIAVCSVRTGCGKSQTTRQVCRILRRLGKTVVVVRHPMAYGDLLQQEVQRFVHYDDFARHHCTIEEREEYEPLVEMGVVVYAGVDYGKILARAEAEAEVIIWDGGNNDTPFFRPDLHLVLLDAHRPGHETEYYPGEANLRLADVAIINKVDSAPPENVERLRAAVARLTPQAQVLLAASPLLVCHPERLRGRRVLVVEDAPTLTHGEMLYGAGMVAARTYGVAEVVDPRPFAAGSLRQLYQDYPRLAPVLPAMGYTPQQMQDLEATINAADCDLVVFATPIKLTKLLRLNKPAFRVRYTYEDVGRPTLEEVIAARMAQWR
jgi:predicted GTPase